MQTCKQFLEIHNSYVEESSPFVSQIQNSGIAKEDIKFFDNNEYWYCLIKGSWGYDINWFSKRVSFQPLSDGIVFFLLK